MDMRLILLGAGCAVITYSLCHVYRLVAVAVRIVDQPNHRSAHEKATPTGAGVCFVLTISLVILFLSTRLETTFEVAFLYPLILVAILGLWDDFRDLSWAYRAPVHFAAAAWVIGITGFPALSFLGIDFGRGYTALAFGTIALVWLLNLYNFMDGIDAIAIGEAVFVFSSVIALIVVKGDPVPWRMVVMLGCCAGFLVINWPQARVFMGDAGSGFLGLLFGYLALYELGVNLWVWMILLGWFVSDTCLTIVLRLFRGEKIHEAHNSHAYQHLNRAVGVHRTLLVLLAVNVCWLLPIAYFADQNREIGGLLLGCALAPLLALQFLVGAGQAQPRIKKLAQ